MPNPDNEPDSVSKQPEDPGAHAPVRPAKLLAPRTGKPGKSGKSGMGASGAMAQIARDHLTAARVEWTTEDQIKDLWRGRAAGQRKRADVLELQAWLIGNAPELLPPGEGTHEYLLHLLCGEIDP